MRRSHKARHRRGRDECRKEAGGKGVAWRWVKYGHQYMGVTGFMSLNDGFCMCQQLGNRPYWGKEVHSNMPSDIKSNTLMLP